MKTIYRAADILEAHIVCGMLNAEGIEAEVAGFYQQGAVGQLAPQDFARVLLLDERDEARAERVIADYEQREPAPSPERERAGEEETPEPEESSRLAWWLVIAALVVLLVSWGMS
ncbi:DUF2007 domain-containing protein [Guyparkeria halophila]|uniref:DUF2007 domain-containing protein n=1 Tax=Guyparkeria halophila TaxID=47960 RepID=A0ABZ0YUC1_9GAMM|nr:DUF2007 domain-containing protein [Guyparkeria halophila]WQH15775.1 DUF2007 domain-containing protein [Guyparkeria halophila]